MEFTIYRDLPSIAFIRCYSALPGTEICAEGTAFSVGKAIAKCRSEWIEASFQLRHPECANIVGIAAHPSALASETHAYEEALETLFLERLSIGGSFYGISIPLGRYQLAVGRISGRFIALFRFHHLGTPSAAQAVSKNPLKAVLRAWTEARNLGIYKPAPQKLPSYTKANRILGARKLESLTVKNSFRKNELASVPLQRHQVSIDSHTITYFLKEKSA